MVTRGILGSALLGSGAAVGLLAPMAGAAELDDLEADVRANAEHEIVTSVDMVTGGDATGS